MKFAIVSTLFLWFSSIGGYNPDHARLIYPEGKNGHEHDNGVEVTLTGAFFHHYHRKIHCAVFVQLVNPTDKALTINRDEFSLVSEKGIAYAADPFTSWEGGIFSKLVTYPSVYTVPAHQTADYVFSWTEAKKFDHATYLAMVKSDTPAFVRRKPGHSEVLCKVALDK